MRAALVLLLFAAPSTAWAQDEEPGAPRIEAEASRARSSVRPFRLGLVHQWWMGVGGQLDNPSPAYVLSLDFGFPTGRAMRYHLEIAYQNLNDYSGLRVSPMAFGYEIPIEQSFLPPEAALEIEVILSIVQAEVLFGPGYAISLSSGMRAQAILSWNNFFAGLSFIGFEVRYAYGVEDVGIRTGVGVNWPIHLILGIEL